LDLNELYSRHQIALMRLADARSPLEQECYRAEVGHFAERIAFIRRGLGAPGAPVHLECRL
jgi:hypothetical protein